MFQYALCIHSFPGNSLAVWWFGLRAFTHRARVRSLVGELRSHKPRSVAKKRKKKTLFSIFHIIFLLQIPRSRSRNMDSFLQVKNRQLFFLNIYLCIYLFSLHRVLVAACRIFLASCGIFSCGMRTLSCGMHAGSSSLTRDRTQAPSIGSSESYPLDHQGSLEIWIILSKTMPFHFYHAASLK